jgi:type III restriction enzyme
VVAVEAGLVKVPRIPTDDNAGSSVPRYRNLWPHIRAAADRSERLYRIEGALQQLAGQWSDTFAQWRGQGRPVPPVLIVVCADTELAELIEHYVASTGAVGPELRNREGTRHTVRIDSKLLRQAEERAERTTADAAEQVRRMVATVGREGEPGQDVRCVISVAMLSEGWDAPNVTQILGLRAFTSQLLCEQVVGRGLRRSNYDDLSTPEYVDVYGIPFSTSPFSSTTNVDRMSPLDSLP